MSLRPLRGVIIPVLLAGVIAYAGLMLTRALVPVEALRQANDAVGTLLQVLGTIYAVLLAFAVFVVWQQFNDARLLVEQEANEIRDLYRTISTGMADPWKSKLQQGIREYLELVLTREWQAMHVGDDALFEPAWRVLERIWDDLHGFEPTDECSRTLYGAALMRFNDLSDARTRRVSAGRTRMPPGLRLLLYVGAAMVIASMYLLPVDRASIHAVLVVVLAGAIAHVLQVVEDLDDAFAGDWQVSSVSFERVRKSCAEPTS